VARIVLVLTVSCGPGSYIDTASSSCTPCPTGTYQDEANTYSCMPCSSGTYSANDGSATCNQCEIGTYQSDVGMPTCVACLAGRFTSTTGSETCTYCDTNHYQDNQGRSECIPCPPGSSAKDYGSTSLSHCKCYDRKYLNIQTSGEASCQACPVGMEIDSKSGNTCLGRYSYHVCNPFTQPYIHI
jgi:hypothetical protein